MTFVDSASNQNRPAEKPLVSGASSDGCLPAEEPGGLPEGPQGVWATLRRWLASVPRIPLMFLGLGVYRAWLNVVLGAGSGAPGLVTSQNLFDVAMVVVLLVCAFGARHLTPLHERPWARLGCGALLLAATLLGYASFAGAALGGAVAILATVMGGAGIALMILLWSELYGTLSPVRICLYYCASLVAGAVVSWVYDGFKADWLPTMTAVLPVVSLLCLRTCYRENNEMVTRQQSWARFSFPWKPVLVVAVYSFAFGLLQTGVSEVTRSTSAMGTVVCAVVVMGAVVLLRSRVEFASVYGMGLPFMSAVFLILGAVLPASSGYANFFATWGYAASQVFIMTMIGSICYHWGASAIWLFGLERSVRCVATIGGRVVDGALVAAGFSVGPLLVVAVMVATFVVFSEKKLDSTWGVLLREQQDDPERSQGVEQRNALTAACAELAKACNLSQREEEVLLLLAQHKTARDIEQELCVANGTAKAHIRHVYQKLGIHTREELFERVEKARG